MGAADRLIARHPRLIDRCAIPVILLFASAASCAAQQTSLELDPGQTSIRFTLGDVLHTVHGTFHLKSGALQFDRSSGKISGEIVVDARSGESGSGMRDRKMHKEVLESERYPDISFRPDRIEGQVVTTGRSTVQVHGIFRIHGTDREITVPADVEMLGDHWNATVHFTVPYAKWGMKNPSTLFLRVSDSVEIDMSGTGTATPANAAASISQQQTPHQ
jgi:polyisoprenoid-binding protein YceI